MLVTYAERFGFCVFHTATRSWSNRFPGRSLEDSGRFSAPRSPTVRVVLFERVVGLSRVNRVGVSTDLILLPAATPVPEMERPGFRPAVEGTVIWEDALSVVALGILRSPRRNLSEPPPRMTSIPEGLPGTEKWMSCLAISGKFAANASGLSDLRSASHSQSRFGEWA